MCCVFRQESKVPGTQKQWEGERHKYFGENTESPTGLGGIYFMFLLNHCSSKVVANESKFVYE